MRAGLCAFTTLLVTLPLAAQEPAEPPPAPAAQEPVTEQMILEAIDQLRSTYDRADESVRDGVEAVAPGAQARGAALRPAEEALGQLVAEMEALLALLPRPPPPPSGSSAQPKSGNKPDSRPQGAQSPSEGDPNDPRAGGRQDQTRGNQPPDGVLLDGLLPTSYARWGLLPPRLQEALRSTSASDVPLRYRRWLEQYHQRGVGTPR